MPMITVRYVTPEPRPDLPEQIAALATRLAANHLGKRSEVTAVLVESAAPGSWFIAGQEPTRLGLSAFWLTITITAGTNAKAETAAFVRAAFDGMQELLGPVREESYVLAQAVDEDAYGYGGRTLTQAERKQCRRATVTDPSGPGQLYREWPEQLLRCVVGGLRGSRI